MPHYYSLFIIPKGAIKALTTDGWEFNGGCRLALNPMLDLLTTDLNMVMSESYLDIMNFENDSYKASVILSDNNEVEFIHFKIYQNSEYNIISAFKTKGLDKFADIFTPSKNENLSDVHIN